MEMAIYEVFREAGFDEPKAKAIAATFNKAFEQHSAVNSEQLATKGDIAELRHEMKAEVEKAKSEIIKWMFGAIIAAAGLAMAIARLFFTAA